jgi:hypothetical protein
MIRDAVIKHASEPKLDADTGSNLGSDSHLMTFLPSLWFSNGGINACEPEFEFRRLCRVGWLLRV